MVFTREDAARAAQTIGIDFKKEAFQLEDLLNGMNTELARHGTKAGTVDVTHDDPTMTAKLAVSNLRVSPSYYSQRVGKSAWERSLARGVKHKGAKVRSRKFIHMGSMTSISMICCLFTRRRDRK